MLVKPLCGVESLKLPLNPGDTLNLSENPPQAVDGATDVIVTAQKIAAGDLLISGGATISATLPSAEQLVNALRGSVNVMSPPGNALYGTLPNQQAGPLQWPGNAMPIDQGSTFRRSFINSNSATATLTAPATAGVTVAGTATVATSKWREFMIRILNSTPSCILALNLTNTSKVLTLYPSTADRSLLAQITPGMSVYGTSIGSAAKVDSVNLDTGTITVTVASTGDVTNGAVTFTPTVVYQNIRAGDV